MEFADRRETTRPDAAPAIARELFETKYRRSSLDERESTGFIATGSRDQAASTPGYDTTWSPLDIDGRAPFTGTVSALRSNDSSH